MDQNKKASPWTVFAGMMGALVSIPLWNIIRLSPVLNDILCGLGLIAFGLVTFYVIRKRIVAQKIKIKGPIS
jgi:hypothetical protein